MICYLDASALVKRYVAEPGSEEVEETISGAEAVGTVMITRVEVASAFGKAVRCGALSRLKAWPADLPELVESWKAGDSS